MSARFPRLSSPPLQPQAAPTICLLTIDSCIVPGDLTELSYPTYKLFTTTDSDMNFLVDTLRLPSTSSLPCVALLSASGLSVVRNATGDPVPYSSISSNLPLLNSLSPPPQLRIMVSGSSSHCGKTTFTLLLLASLQRRGLKCGYLKPTTQCEAGSIVTKYCKVAGVKVSKEQELTRQRFIHSTILTYRTLTFF